MAARFPFAMTSIFRSAFFALTAAALLAACDKSNNTGETPMGPSTSSQTAGGAAPGGTGTAGATGSGTATGSGSTGTSAPGGQ